MMERKVVMPLMSSLIALPLFFRSSIKSRSSILLLPIFIFVSSATTYASFSADQDDVPRPSDYGVFDWIHNSPGGYFNPKQEFRYEIPGDPSSIPGIFASEDIVKGEVLVKVPWKFVLRPDDEDKTGPMCCGTVTNLVKEMKLGKDSEFAPYVQYLLKTQPHDQLPSAWSEEGKDLLRKIVGGKQYVEIPPAEPTEWLEFDWFGRCNGDPSDHFSSKAALLVVQRADDANLIPGYDMYNHRNGKWMNTKTNTHPKKHHMTVASRNIKAGEQIYISYNHCEECAGRDTEYGTGEILRDYGFLENYPQEWHFMKLHFTIDEEEDGSLTLIWHQENMKPDEEDYERFLVHLNRQIQRIRGIRNLSRFDLEIKKIRQTELDIIWSFLEANIVAMNMAIEVTENEFVEKKGDISTYNDGYDDYDEVEGAYSNTAVVVNGSHYDHFGYEYDDLDYSSTNCDNNEIMEFRDYDLIEMIETTHQEIGFTYNPKDGDICLDIDETLQICSCNRPHYHEFAVHAAARFVDTVSRVIVIGGGDSMLLHEVLKYPTLELIVSLELDQTVVRKSFKHFKTQPHFDDDRVEWWFGDATKSLLLLPKEYWQSFDLLLVDISETAMSLSVTEELDVFGALALLLKPGGVMVKSEFYFDKMSEVFDYMTQIHFESPIICSQTLALGSNTVNFLTATPKDHHIETLLYKPLVNEDNHLDYVHDFRKNDARAQGKCGEVKIPDSVTEMAEMAGIFTIVNAEKTNIPLDDGPAVAESIRSAIEAQGFSLLSIPVYVNDSVYIVMREGYIVARLWPNKDYCAFDIHLWGRWGNMRSLQGALVEAVQSKQVSSYRVVVGGMSGFSIGMEEQAVGPRIVQTRNCAEPPTPTDFATTSEQMIEVALRESLKLLPETKDKALAICGVKGRHECLAANLLGEFLDAQSVSKVFTCPGLNKEGVSKEVMYECEFKTLAKLKKIVGTSAKDRLNLVVVDSTVPYPMMQVLHSILRPIKEMGELVRKQNLFIALYPSDEDWRQQFLDRYRKRYASDPISRAHILLRNGRSSVGFGLVSCGDNDSVHNIELFALDLQGEFDRLEKDISVELHSLIGGELPYVEDFEPKKFLQTDYDETPGIIQFNLQEFLGRQNIFQLVQADDADSLQMSSSRLKALLETGIDLLNLQIQNHQVFHDVGEGCVHIFVCEGGSVVGVWDGRDHIDICLFTYDEWPEATDNFIRGIVDSTGGNAKLSARDDQPRGVGRAINFPSDMLAERRKKPSRIK